MPATSLRSARAVVVLSCAAVFFAMCLWLVAGAEPATVQKAFVASLMLCTLGVMGLDPQVPGARGQGCSPWDLAPGPEPLRA